MQAVKAYYDEGKFFPLQPVKIPKGSRAIITILDPPTDDDPFLYDRGVASRESRLEWLSRLEAAIDQSTDEDLPDWAFERSKEMRPPLDLAD